jgi:hypothetical protein
MKQLGILLGLLLISSIAFAQASPFVPDPTPTNKSLGPLDKSFTAPATADPNPAKWFSVLIKYSRDSVLTNAGFCNIREQCLLDNIGNFTFDNQTDRFYKFEDHRQWPRCINSGQYVLDHLCDKGNWTSRTRGLFLRLADYASQTSPDNFSLACAPANEALNKLSYLVAPGKLAGNIIGRNCRPSGSPTDRNCVNNVCVLEHEKGIAIGFSLNEPIDSANSILISLNETPQACNGVTGLDYGECTPEIYYNQNDNTVIYSSALPEQANPPSLLANTFNQGISYSTILDTRMTSMKDYATTVAASGYDYLSRPQDMRNMALIRRGNKEIFSLKEEGKTALRADFTLLRYSNIDLGTDPCTNIFKRFALNDQPICEEQSGTDYFVLSQSADNNQSLSGAWMDLALKIRP